MADSGPSTSGMQNGKIPSKSDPILEYWTSEYDSSAEKNQMKCNYCGVFRKRELKRLKTHIVKTCPTAPIDVRKKFVGQKDENGCALKIPDEILKNGPQPPPPSTLRAPTSRGPPPLRKRKPKDDDDLPPGLIKAMRQVIEEGVKTKPSRFRKTMDEMEREEHDAKVRILNARSNLLGQKEKTFTTVGHSIATFLSSFDAFLRHVKNKSMVGSNALLIRGEGESNLNGHPLTNGND